MRTKLRLLFLFLLAVSLGNNVLAQKANLTEDKGWKQITELPADVNKYFFAIYDHTQDLGMVLKNGNHQGADKKTMWYTSNVNPESNKDALWMFASSGEYQVVVNANYPNYFLQTEMNWQANPAQLQPWYFHTNDNGGGDPAWGQIEAKYDLDSWIISLVKAQSLAGKYIGAWEDEIGIVDGAEIAGNKDGNGKAKIGQFDIFAITRGQYVKAAEDLESASVGTPVDISYVITSNDAEIGFLGWTNGGFATQNNTAFGNKNGTIYMEAYQNSGNLPNKNISQSISGLPKGTYKLTVRTSVTAAGAFLFANSATAELKSQVNGTAVLYFEHEEGADLNIGVKLENFQSNWVNFDYFQLYYCGNPKEKLATAIAEAEELQKSYLDSYNATAKSVWQKYLDNAKNINNDADNISPEVIEAAAINLANATKQIEAIIKAYTDGGVADFTFAIVNPCFTEGATGWTGGPAVNNQIAEKFDTNYNVYQTIQGLPAGTYFLSYTGFYRNGDYVPAADKHQDGTENLAAIMYAGDNYSKNLPSIFSEYKHTATQANGGNAYTTKTVSGYVPNNMAEASNTFYDKENIGYADGFAFTVDENGTITIGVKKEIATTHDWTAFTNFTLTYYGTADKVSELNIEQEAKLKAHQQELLNTNIAVVPTLKINVGDGVFQIPTTLFTELDSKYEAAQTTEDYSAADKALVKEIIAVIAALQTAELNEPEKGKRYTLQNRSKWAGYGKWNNMQDSYLTFVKDARADQGNYGINLGIDLGADAKGYTLNPAYAQAFIFTKADGINKYYISQIDEDGKTERYMTTAKTAYTNNNPSHNQIRTTTDKTKAYAFTIVPTSTEGQFTINVEDADNGTIDFQDAGAFVGAFGHSNFAIAEAEEATVSISVRTGKYATVIFPFAPSIPEDADLVVYEEKIGEDNILELTEVDAPAANTPYILYSKNGYTAPFTGFGTAAKDAYGANDLVGVYTNTVIEADKGNYVLQIQDDKQAFYQVTTETGEFKAVPYRAYLTVPTTEAKAFYFGFGDDATAIKNVEVSKDAEKVFYNLAGQRVANPTKGIYIVNGKKVLVK